MLAAPSPVRGVVFDLNGTLVDDIRFHRDAWDALAQELGLPMDEARFQSFNGLKNADIVPKLLGRDVTDAEAAQISERKEAAYREMYRPHLALVPGALALLARLRAASIPVAIASSAPPENRAMVIDGLGLGAYVTTVVAAEHLPGKPAPDVFLEAARQLGVAPADCLAFEDAANGVRAAAAAGMLVGAVTTNNPAESLLAAGAAFAISDFTQLPPEIDARLPPAPARSMTTEAPEESEPTQDIAAMLVANHRDFLAFVQRRVGSASVAEEILQDAFVRNLDKLDTVRETAVGWFYRVLRNAIIDHHRRNAAAERRHDAYAREAQLDADQDRDEELHRAVCKCVAQLAGTLKPEYTAALKRIEIDGLSVKDFADEAGISSNNAGVRIFRAREALRKQVARACGTCATHGCLDCTCDQGAKHGCH